MILDKLDNFRYYQRCIPEIWDAVRFVEKVKCENLPAGRYPVGKGFAFGGGLWFTMDVFGSEAPPGKYATEALGYR